MILKIKKTNNNLLTFIFINLVSILNILFLFNKELSLIFVIFQLFILFKFIINNDIFNYFKFYLVFTLLSVEHSFFLGTNLFYNFQNFRLFGINLAVLTLFYPIIYIFISRYNKHNLFNFKKQHKYLYNSLLIFMLLNITGLFVGLISLLINDNNIQILNSFISIYINNSYYFLTPFFIIIIIC